MLPLAITMGCPAGIGPEIILKYFSLVHGSERPECVVLGDRQVLRYYGKKLGVKTEIVPWTPGGEVQREQGVIPLYSCSTLQNDEVLPGHPSARTATAMADAIISAVHGIQDSHFSALCTCPISKKSLQESGHHYPGHTELLASLTRSSSQVMMMAGATLRVTLATIHCALARVPQLLTIQSLFDLFLITHESLRQDFGLENPRIAVAGLNPHAGEDGLFGDEEERVICPAMQQAQDLGLDLHGPFPPDTIFPKAARGEFDVVVCMYHDQGLIPFKLLHFSDGVNVTLGLPIVRTSVDHGTAYDIAGRGLADPASLTAAVRLAADIVHNRSQSSTSSQVTN